MRLQETLPESYVLPIEFKSTDPYHTAGGFADVWKGTYKEGEVAFKSIRGSTLSDYAARLKLKVRNDVFPTGRLIPLHCIREGFARR
jgi:hypothetical protein